MLTSSFSTPVCVTVLECPAIFLDTVGFGCIDRCYCQLMFIVFKGWLMLLPTLFFVADVLATVVHVWWNWHEARCYGLDYLWLMLSHCVFVWWTDVVVTVEVNFVWQMLWPVLNTSTVARSLCPWLMLLPLGLFKLMLLPLYWFETDVIAFFVAYVVAWWLMLLPHAVFGWCYCQWWLMLNPPMGVWQMLWQLGQCFNFNSDVVFKTSSHMWGIWYLAYISHLGMGYWLNSDNNISHQQIHNVTTTSVTNNQGHNIWPHVSSIRHEQ